MKTILCVTDFSVAAENTIRYISELAQPVATRLILFCNIKPIANTTGINGDGPSHFQLMAELEERKEYLNVFEELKKRLELHNPLSTISYDIQIRHGLAKDTITDLVQKEQVDVVVLCNAEINELLDKSKQKLAAELKNKTAIPVLIAASQALPDPEMHTALGAALQKELHTGAALLQELAEF